MEGLIPLVYQTLKKNKTRRQYECLSSGAAQSYNVAEFYVTGQRTHDQGHVCMTPSTAESRDGGLKTDRNGHRRHMSMDMAYSSADCKKTAASPTPVPKLMRFRSHRMFSCVTGP